MRRVVLVYKRLQAHPLVTPIEYTVLWSLLLLQAAKQVQHELMRVMLLNGVELLGYRLLQIQ